MEMALDNCHISWRERACLKKWCLLRGSSRGARRARLPCSVGTEALSGTTETPTIEAFEHNLQFPLQTSNPLPQTAVLYDCCRVEDSRRCYAYPLLPNANGNVHQH